MSPLRSIPFPQKTQIDPSKNSGSSTSNFNESRAAETFDLVNIHITVYALSGIMCRVEDCRKRGVANKALRGLEGKKRVKGRKGKTTPIPIGERSSQRKQMYTPTTAVVSCQRNIVSSGTAIETFLPSQSLRKPSLAPGQSSRQTAIWNSSESTHTYSFDTKEQERCTTFSITRVMQRQAYHPFEEMGQIANYIPETIDLNVGVCRGKDKIPLAVASVAVTGEEEGETIISAPVKQTRLKEGRRKLFKSGSMSEEKKRNQASFSSDPEYSYSLEENAILRVGVRVSPYQGGGDDHSLAKKETLDDILAGMFEENVILELNDENCLLEQLARTGTRPGTRAGTRARTESVEVQMPQSILRGLFCGAMEMCSENSILYSKEEERQEQRTVSKKTAAEVLPLSLMSSVSHSTLESRSGSPVFRQQRATF
jgi:hypothetical protein